MIRLLALLRRLRDERDGAAAIEAAFVMPVLAMMSLGSFETANVIARQSELQGAMAEAASVALAAEPTTPSRRDTLKGIIENSVGEGPTVTVDEAFRCGTSTQLVTTTAGCGTTRASSYVKVALTETYTPIWAKYGLGNPLTFRVTRYVLVKQQAQTGGGAA